MTAETEAMTQPESPWLWLAVATFGLLGSALWSGFETAVYTMNPVRLSVRAAGGDRMAARLLREAAHEERLLTTLLIGNNVSNYLGSLGLTGVLALSGLGEWAIIAAQAVVLTPMLLVFGEALPKEVFRVRAHRLAPPLSPVVFTLRWIATLTLVLPIVLAFARGIDRLLGSGGVRRLMGPREEMLRLLDEGVAAGGLSELQRGLVGRAGHALGSPVGSLMTPWRTTPVVNAWQARSISRRRLARTRLRWLPVVDRSGAVVGCADVLELALGDPDAPPQIVPAVHVHPAMPVGEALRALADARLTVGIVSNGTRPIGLITRHELVEPLLGLSIAWHVKLLRMY